MSKRNEVISAMARAMAAVQPDPDRITNDPSNWTLEATAALDTALSILESPSDEAVEAGENAYDRSGGDTLAIWPAMLACLKI